MQEQAWAAYMVQAERVRGQRSRRLPCDARGEMTHLTECVIGGLLEPCWERLRVGREVTGDSGGVVRVRRAKKLALGARFDVAQLAGNNGQRQVNYRLR